MAVKFKLPDWIVSGGEDVPPPGIACGYKPTWRTIYIYALIDPETFEIRYIGKSIRPEERLANHMNEKSNCHRSHWLQQLKAKGLKPYLLILEENRGGWPWQESERYWIARGRREGWPLTNNTSGGDGVPDLPPESRERIIAASRGRKPSQETLEKLKTARRLRKTKDSTREKMSRAMKGRKITWGDKLSVVNRKFTPEQAAEVKRRLESGERTGDLARELKVHRTTITKIKTGTYHERYRSRKRKNTGL